MTAHFCSSRRTVLTGLGAVGVTSMAGCTTQGATANATQRPSQISSLTPRIVTPPLAPIHMRADLITRITACLRPFRPTGPRLEVESINNKRIVHNYGHGGSGWSLSWGSAEIARDMAMQGGTRTVAVIGCGAIGLTTATLLQQAGAKVVIYARERLPQTRSARATGVWTPDSRLADADRVDASFPMLWEKMARSSWAMHQTYVGQAGDPVGFMDRYIVNDALPQTSPAEAPTPADVTNQIRFVEYGSRLNDIVPRSHDLSPDQFPFPAARVRMGTAMQFNIAELGHRLMSGFISEGGRIETRDFNTAADLSALPEHVIVNCTGYGARDLFGDHSLVPIRGQMAWLPPQPEVRYSLYHNGVAIVSRPDGIGVQKIAGDMFGYGETDESPDRAEAEESIALIAALYARAGITA